MRPHFAVHGRCNEDGGAGGKGDGGESVTGEATGEGGKEVGAGRGDEKKIGAIGELNVTGLPAVFFVEEVFDDGMTGEGLKGERGDEFSAATGQNAGDLVTSLGELAGQVRCAVGGDGAGDA